jgi:hypothetical protein
MQRIRDAVAEIVDDLSAHQETPEASPEPTAEGPLAQISKIEVGEPIASAPSELPAQWRNGEPVLCIPGVGLLDEAVAITLAELIRRRGIGARAKEADILSMAKIFALETKDVKLVCLCYLENATPAQVRYAVRRIRRKAPDAFILVSLLNESDKIEETKTVELSPGTELVKGSLTDTVQRILDLANGKTPARSRSEIPLSHTA